MRFVHYYPDAMGDSGVTVALWGWATAIAAAGLASVVLHADGRASRQAAEPFVNSRGAAVKHQRIAHRGRGRLTRHPVDLARHLQPDDILVLHEGWVSSNTIAAESASRATCRRRDAARRVRAGLAPLPAATARGSRGRRATGAQSSGGGAPVLPVRVDVGHGPRSAGEGHRGTDGRRDPGSAVARRRRLPRLGGTVRSHAQGPRRAAGRAGPSSAGSAADDHAPGL